MSAALLQSGRPCPPLCIPPSPWSLNHCQVASRALRHTQGPCHDMARILRLHVFFFCTDGCLNVLLCLHPLSSLFSHIAVQSFVAGSLVFTAHKAQDDYNEGKSFCFGILTLLSLGLCPHVEFCTTYSPLSSNDKYNGTTDTFSCICGLKSELGQLKFKLTTISIFLTSIQIFRFPVYPHKQIMYVVLENCFYEWFDQMMKKIKH